MGMAGELGREAGQGPLGHRGGHGQWQEQCTGAFISHTRWGSGSSCRPQRASTTPLLHCNARDSNTTVSPVKSYCRFLEAGAADFFSLSRAAFLPSPYGVSPLAFFSAARRASKSASSSSAARGRQLQVIAG